jgi:HD superfamily phosphodiesterase
MYTAEEFAPELAFIKDQTIRDFTEFCLKNAPPYFYEVPSSSTGKYHSAWSNGPGGLVRHTKATAYVAAELGDAYGLAPEEKDAAVAAALLHDICKYGLMGGKYTSKIHDYEGSNFVFKLSAKFTEATGAKVPLLKDICSAVAYHFGRWTAPVENRPIRQFPEEYSKIDQLVHIADMVASRKEVRFNFLEHSMIG